MATAISESIEVRIRNLAVGGDGVGEVTAGPEELLGITAFVPFTGPGEIVQAGVTEQKKNFVRGSLLSVIHPSPGRVEPPCRYYGSCGGCELQHLNYELQLEWKEQMVRGAMQSARFSAEEIGTLEPVVPSPPFGYRRRLSLHISRDGELGFYRPNSRVLVPIEECLIAVPEISALLPKVRAYSPRWAGQISALFLEADIQGVIAVLKAPYALSKGKAQEILTQAKEIFESAIILEQGKEVAGFGRKILELPLDDRRSLSLRVPAGSFSQVNWAINTKLIAGVCEAAEIGRESEVYDLYAGAGNFSLPLAAAGARVTAVECDTNLVGLGRQNSVRYGLERNLNYVESSVERFLSAGEKRNGGKQASVVISDPPRSGLGRLVGETAIAPRYVLISCHLPSFIRDAKALIELGYRLERVRPYDMFAQTSYLEVLSVFSRSH